MNGDYIIVYTTVSDSETAASLADSIIEKRLAACAQIEGPIKSVYWWQGEREREEEWKIGFKSSTRLYKSLEAEIIEIHPYDTPEIVATPIVSGNPKYLRWLEAELLPGKEPMV